MVVQNSLGLTATGIVTHDGAGVLTGSAVTQYGTVVAGASNAVASVAPSATTGVPLISQGSSANPAYGTAVVAGGGTGVASTTAYAVVCGGTTTTAALQPVASLGTSGQILTSTGASSLPTFQTAAVASGTGWVFLSSVTASADATVVMTSGIDTTYNRYMITITDLIPETDTAVLNMRTSTDGGATYDATAGDYSYLSTFNDNSGASSITSTSATFMTMTLSGGSGVGNGTGESLNSNIILCNPSAAVTYKKIFLSTIYTTAGAQYATCTGSGVRLDTADIDAVQFLMSTGEITSGVFKLYGLTAS